MIKLILPIAIVIVLICFFTSNQNASLPVKECDKTKAVIVDCKMHDREGRRAGNYIPIDDKNLMKLKSVTWVTQQYCDSNSKTLVAAKQECRLITRGVD